MRGPGVPWNGLVSAALDSIGGDVERYYFDGVKYMERALAEEFQLNLQVINTPKEFEPCEGVRTTVAGMKTYFNKRDKFNMSWRTIIGNDQNPEAGYKLHLAYNCLVAPSSRTWQTIGSNAAPDIRTLTITTTPACGRHSYYSFDSRETDLSALEARLYVGDLPHCWELPGLVGIDTSLCPELLIDFEEYFPGQILTGDVVDDHFYRKIIGGKVNNGLDVTELPANGTVTANDATISVVGTGDVLTDDDDTTYISSADGDLGYTIQLPVLENYVEGSTLELHIRMSISGDVSEDDPNNIDADAQVFITTDAAGDDEIGGFTDGTDEGMGFALSTVDGTPVDYVVNFDISAWTDTSIEAVVDALKTGAYLNIVSVNNNNPSTTPEVRVYEASVAVVNATDKRKFLRADGIPNFSYINEFMYESADGSLRGMDEGSNRATDNVIETALVTFQVDFKARKISTVGISGTYWTVQPMCWFYPVPSAPALLQFEYASDQLVLRLYDQAHAGDAMGAWDSGIEVADQTDISDDVWYRIVVDWGVYEIRYRLYNRDDDPKAKAPIKDVTLNYNRSDSDPIAYMVNYGGTLFQDPNAHDIYLDNAKTSMDCSLEIPSEIYMIPRTVYAEGGLQAAGAYILNEDPKTDTSSDTSGVTLVDNGSMKSVNAWIGKLTEVDPYNVTRLVLEVFGAAYDSGIADGTTCYIGYQHAFTDSEEEGTSAPYVDFDMKIPFVNDSTLTPVYRQYEISDEYYGNSLTTIARRLAGTYSSLTNGPRAMHFVTRGGVAGTPTGTKTFKLLSARLRIEYAL